MSSPVAPVKRIALLEPELSGKERAYLEECVTSGYVSSVGPFVERFERAFADCVGSRHAVACASGTAAIHVALRVLGVVDGDEVMVSNLTFVASANPILYERAVPVLVDSEATSWNLDPALVVAELDRRARTGTKQPRAIEVVHVLGQPANIEPIAQACERYGVDLFEDAAESLGAQLRTGRWAGRQVGTIGRVGCFSFNGNKTVTTGGGGMIVTDDGALAARARHLTQQAKVAGASYFHDDVGYNYRLTNIAAALGLAQLEHLPQMRASKVRIAARYRAALTDTPGIELPHCPWGSPSEWLTSILVDPVRFGATRDDVLSAMAGRAIETRPIWTPLHLMPKYRNAPRLGGEVSEHLFANGLSLPSSSRLEEADQRCVLDGIDACRRGKTR
jgi:dTDP-4-amino-4,6-dideoxygalactose transaminase